jgi:pimeloyl-ACP methyl ester carboxylesterase
VQRVEIAGMSTLAIGPKTAPIEAIFLHANGFNAAPYVDVLRPLARERRILAPDLRGYGRTRLPADPERLSDWRPFVKDVTALLTSIDAPAIVLAGHSLGGSVAFLTAAETTARVRALALFEPVLPPPPFGGPELPGETPQIAADTRALAAGALGRRRRFADREAAFEAYRGRGGFRTWPEPALRAYVEEGFLDIAETDEGGEGVALACDPAWEAAAYLARGDNLWGTLAGLSAPLTIRAAPKGSTFPPESEVKLRGLRPDADIARVEGTTHFLPIERPDVVREMLGRVLGSGD